MSNPDNQTKQYNHRILLDNFVSKYRWYFLVYIKYSASFHNPRLMISSSYFIYASLRWFFFSTNVIFSFKIRNIYFNYSTFVICTPLISISFFLFLSSVFSPRSWMLLFWACYLMAWASSFYLCSSALIFLNSCNNISIIMGTEDANFWHSSSLR